MFSNDEAPLILKSDSKPSSCTDKVSGRGKTFKNREPVFLAINSVAQSKLV